MRELPEPDGFVDAGKIHGMTYSESYYLTGSVLAIQKQAYEDGLRDAIPEGYVLAPLEPTQEMCAVDFDCDDSIGIDSARICYKAMLKASKDTQ